MPERPFETVATKSPIAYQTEIDSLPRLLDASDFDFVPSYRPSAGRSILARLLASLRRK